MARRIAKSASRRPAAPQVEFDDDDGHYGEWQTIMLMALKTAQADRAEIDNDIRQIVASMASEHGMGPLPYPPVQDRV